MAWQTVEATHRVSGARRSVQMNVFPQGEIEQYARVWFPEKEFKDHEIKPMQKEDKTIAGSDKRHV